ncbi:DUF4139 domain-containing protein [Micromonospora sp. HM5-17]|jgi:hypothetical protein|uniref:DUF4139 domain-containing protein n=1 Tax=Micromonospora sp. HM5-17 TaxID=2487710 RepID=UPI000F49B5EA|nr:DUF4139 domain-containing protein [Micromonospora sp. HM5-17]ROT26848.1 mucoidy inhibitor MuiA family protein [Micromonospora sp. HM5-17]
MTSSRIDAPIVAVTVYPDRARVTRRADLRLAPGEHRLRIGSLPLGLHRDSVRVSGQGPASVLGVDIVTEVSPRTSDQTAAELEQRRRDLAAELVELADAEAVETQRAEVLTLLAQRAGGTYARALASGEATPADVGGFLDSVAEQTAASQARRRELNRRRDDTQERLAAVERELAALPGKRQPDRLAAEVVVRVDADGGTEPESAGAPADPESADPGATVRLDLSYVVAGAGWTSSYDLRLVDETLTVTWFGLVSQRTGEDWPECELELSTARPTTGTALPELTPWYLDQADRTVWAAEEATRGAGPVRVLAAAAAGAPGGPPPPAPTGARHRAAPVAQPTATLEQGVVAATYRPARPVAVPADGAAHRAVVAVLDLTAALDYLTAPVRTPDVHLRATVVNSSPHTLLPGPASVFHGGDFVGSTPLPVWAPGEEVELALGLDDRIRVKRELVRRTDTKATLGSTRRREVEYRTTVANHTPRPARVTVLDQLPVSRAEGITVRELRLDPAPTERGDLGELRWRLELAPGASREIVFGLRVELAKGVELVGWRE